MTAASTSFTAEAASVPTARQFVCSTLEGWDLRAAYDAAELLVSEVVTNAVLHAGTNFTVEVARVGDTVRVRVTDRSRAVPRQRAYGTDSVTGRGLRLVATLSLAWGVEQVEGGKCVWFDVSAAGDAGTEVTAWDADADLDALLAGFDDLDEGPGAPGGPRGLKVGTGLGTRAALGARGALRSRAVLRGRAALRATA